MGGRPFPIVIRSRPRPKAGVGSMLSGFWVLFGLTLVSGAAHHEPSRRTCARGRWIRERAGAGMAHCARAGPTTDPAGPGADPAWSADGQWLAYLVPVQPGHPNRGRLGVVRWNGTDRHVVAGIPPLTVGSFSWSPRADGLAVAPGGLGIIQPDVPADISAGAPPPSGPARVEVVSPTGQPRPLTPPGWRVEGALVWSPNGRLLAFARGPARFVSGLYTVNVKTRTVVARWRAPGDLWPAGWWPDGHGMRCWTDPAGSGSVALDGLRLESLAFGGRAPQALAVTLPYSDFVATRGAFALVVAGRGRVVSNHKRLLLCRLTTAVCRPLPMASGSVALDPAPGPAGQWLYVGAQSRGNVGGWVGPGEPSSPLVTLRAWLSTRTLRLVSGSRGQGRQVTAAGTGIADPGWIPVGPTVLYVRDGAIDVWNPRTDRVQAVTGPFVPLTSLFGSTVTWIGANGWLGPCAADRCSPGWRHDP